MLNVLNGDALYSDATVLLEHSNRTGGLLTQHYRLNTIRCLIELSASRTLATTSTQFYMVADEHSKSEPHSDAKERCS